MRFFPLFFPGPTLEQRREKLLLAKEKNQQDIVKAEQDMIALRHVRLSITAQIDYINNLDYQLQANETEASEQDIAHWMRKSQAWVHVPVLKDKVEF